MRTITITLFWILIPGLLLVSCGEKGKTESPGESGSQVFDISQSESEVRAKTDRFTAAHITRDTAFLNNIFTEDARVFAPNSARVVGKKAIPRVNAEWVEYGIHEFEEKSTLFYGNKDYLIDEGTYFLRYGDENIIDRGKYINIWKNEGGEWKMYSNIWNTDLPLPIED